MLMIEASVRTDVGCVRDANEDAARFVRPHQPEQRRRKGLLVIVADGMGGHAAGEEASRLATDVVSRVYYAHEGAPQTALIDALQQANRAIYEAAQADPDRKGMGTTCTVVAILGDRAYLAHVGDSRMYLLREGTLRQMSEDHTLVQAMVKDGTLSAEEADTHEEKNVILRALGTRPQVEVSTWDAPVQLLVNDRLLLCSDGLYDLVTFSEIEQLSALKPFHLAGEALVALAKERGGYDNITVALLEVRDPQATRTERHTRDVEVLSW